MKKYLIALILFLTSIVALPHNFATYSFGFGYSRFNEAHGSKSYKFRNNQFCGFGTIYGVYIDVSLGLKEWSDNDGMKMTSVGMDYGYLFPLNKKSYYKPWNFYLGPVVGFQRVGTWFDAPYRDYVDEWGYYHYGEAFEGDCTYFNYGVVAAISHKKMWVQTKLSKMCCGVGIGVKF